MNSPLVWIIAVLVGLVVVVLISLVAIYNRLVTLRQRYLNAYAQIDVQLKRRYDLIPNLVETVKGYMQHERETLTKVMEARNAAASANAAAAANPGNVAAIAQVAGAENVLIGLLARFRMLVEAYPDLKANQTTARLMEELASTENRVAFARQAYNDSVMSYNTTRQKFPTNLIAPILGFGQASLFQIDEAAERQVVRVAL